MPLKASAPGSLMLLGEYAVLYGKQALVTAIDKRITVTLTPRQDQTVFLHSERLGCFETNLADIEIKKPFQFVLGVLKAYQAKIKHGLEIHIDSDFSDTVGLGSSAAVTVAVLAAVTGWLNIRLYPIDFVRQARTIVRQVQGLGSGADVAASVYGGMICFQSQPLSAEKFSIQYPLSVVYSGFKTPTVDAVKQVQQLFSPYPQLLHFINQSIGQCVHESIQLIRKESWGKLGEIMNIQQGMMDALGVSAPILRDMITELRKHIGILGAKISGAGLGDCVIGLGELSQPYHLPHTDLGVALIPVAMSLQGVTCEKI
jgi:mevalonate kinase